MGLNPIRHYNPIITPPNQNPRSATGRGCDEGRECVARDSGFVRAVMGLDSGGSETEDDWECVAVGVASE
jgi:hypothetical protein